MTKSLSPGLSRLVAVLLLAAVLAGTYVLLVQPLAATYSQQRDAIGRSQQLLARYRALGREGGALDAEAQQLRAVQNLETAYLTGDSDALAAAKLQALVEQMVARHGGQLQATQPLPAVAEEGFKRVAVRIQLSARTEPLRRILYGLEAGQPYLFLDNLEIRRARGSRVQSLGGAVGPASSSSNPGIAGDDGAAQKEEEEPLSVRLDVLGYTQSPGQASADTDSGGTLE